MNKVMVIGAGRIGCLIACLLAKTKEYQVHLVDSNFDHSTTQTLQSLPINQVNLTIQDDQALCRALRKYKVDAVISSLPYYLNPLIAKAAKKTSIHYFDLTEDIKVTNQIKAIAQDAKTAFIPQCGLAPGMVGVIANHLIESFDECYQAHLRVGALPKHSNHALGYALTWSTEGLMNQYDNLGLGLTNKQITQFSPLEGLETLVLSGENYEAFYTSGGLGSLAELYAGKIDKLNYKTIRYPGHCEKIRFLMQDLGLNRDKNTLKTVLEQSVPQTNQDIVIIYVSVQGLKQNKLVEQTYFKKITPLTLYDLDWSAIQISTASGVCAVVDTVLAHPQNYQGFIYQETFDLAAILANRFGQYYI